MAVITYTALRRVIPTHTQGDIYSIEFPLGVHNFDGQIFKTQYDSLDGSHEVVVQSREDDNYRIGATFIELKDLPEWEEFFYSVFDSTPFTFDAFGTLLISDNVQTMIMLSDRHSPTRTSFERYDMEWDVRIDT